MPQRRPISHKKVNTNKLKADLNIRKINLNLKKSETPIVISKQLTSHKKEQTDPVAPVLVENSEVLEDINIPELTIEDTKPLETESENPDDSKGNVSLETNSSQKLFDLKIALVPCSPRTPKKHTNNNNNNTQVYCHSSTYTIVTSHNE